VQAPTVIRTKLPTPDVVIVRDGARLYVVADERVDEAFLAASIREAPHVRDGRPFG
jgi:hypothetical protein